MNNFDGPRNEEMNSFLNFLYAMSKSGNLNHDIVYHALCFYNLKDSDKNTYQGKPILDGRSNENFFEYWEKAFVNMPNTLAFRDPKWPYFFQFISKESAIGDEYIKLYIPLDINHLYKGATDLFAFLDNNKITHLSKISKKVRVDNVIVRLKKDDRESAQKILDFINNNEYIKEGLNKPNPFIPTINGIGIMNEHGNSYNSDLSHYILNYVKICRQQNSGVSALNFKYFLESCKKRNIRYDGKEIPFDNSLLETFNEAFEGKKEVKLNSDMPDDVKNKLIENSFKQTFLKYGIDQVIGAIKCACDGDYKHITNGESLYRNQMKENVNGREVAKYINDSLLSDLKNNPGIDDNKITEYCSNKFGADMNRELETICRVTFDNYGLDQVRRAIRHFVNEKNPNFFSRYRGNDQSINYRDRMKYFNDYFLFDTIKKNLISKGVDVSRLGATDLINTYVDELGMQKNSIYDETPQGL